MIGQTLGHYRIEAKLGEGGMGVVYKAVDTRLNRPVAIKVLPADSVADAERKARFVQEARAASALNHPNIVTIHDIASDGGVDYIVMEYIAGETLDRRIGRQGLSLVEALEEAVQMADALARAHAAGIVHRDLKPANIMVAEDGLIKILDFGLAKLVERDQTDERTVTIDRAPRTEQGMILGTVAYMSPEQAEGKKVDARSDIFSFGSVLYEMLTGRRAFEGETKLSTLTAILHKEPARIGEIVPGAPAEIERIIHHCLRKDPRRRFQHMDDIKTLLDGLKEELISGKLAAGETAVAVQAVPRKRGAIPIAVAALILVAATAGVTWWLSRPPAPKSGMGPVFSQMTFDSGLTTDPALSPDGKLLAYASDRAGENNLDIWVQQVAGGQPLRLTRDPSDDHDPAFSPDGSKIVFRSEREPRGIYMVPTLGGEERLIAHGSHARFSPDGAWIAHDSGDVREGPKIYLVPATGGPSRELQTGIPFAASPTWSPDGKHLLFIGGTQATIFSDLDWWVVGVEGGRAVRTGAAAILRAPALWFTGARDWVGDHVVFSAAIGGSANLWQLAISARNGRIEGAPQRLTVGSGREVQPSAVGARGAGTTVAFASIHSNVNLWSLPLDANQGKVIGQPQRLTEGAADDTRPSISADARKLVFLSNRSGNADVWLRDMTSGRETAITATPANESHPRITRDGARVCYGALEGGRQAIYVASARQRAGVPERICEDCGLPMDWSPDGKKILYWSSPPLRWWTIDVPTREKAEVKLGAEHDVHNIQYSPQGDWISFDVPQEGTVYVAPWRDAVAGERKGWVRVAEGSHAWGSPDGSLLYFLSARDGFACLWAQRLAPETKQPAGEAFNVYHSHGARRAPFSGNLGWGLASGKFVFPMSETTGNIWLAKFE